MATPDEILEHLSRPDAYPHPAGRIEVVQTHISLVFLAGERAYKVKKPLDLGFLDFTTLDRRRRVSEDEVRLNRRLAAGVYLGVAPIARGHDGRLRVHGEGEAVEVAVEMVRLPAERMLDRLLEEEAVGDETMAGLVALLVRFHRDAATGPGVDEHGEPGAVAFNVRENFEQTEPFVASGDTAASGTRVFTPALHAYLREQAERFLAGEDELLRRRVAEGRIRDGHGDLHAGNVCFLPDGIVVYDCIEFADRFRCGDVACDLAFLAMDLDARGYPERARAIVGQYARAAADRELERLVPFYSAYRAMVRAKVSAIAAAEQDLPENEREERRLEAARYAALAAGYQLPPSLVLTCGLPATGKTRAARAIARALRAEHLRSDVVRKRLAGLAPTERATTAFGEGIYGEATSERVRAALVAEAEAALRSGQHAVVDATSATASARAPFLELGRSLGAPVAVLEATAPPAVVRERLRRRAEDPAEASDAGIEVYERMSERYEPPEEVPAEGLVHAPAGEPVEEPLLRLADALARGAAQ